MSVFRKIFNFGDGKEGKGASTPQEAICRLRETEEMLQKKSDFLEKKIEQEISCARKNASKNKKGKYLVFVLYVLYVVYYKFFYYFIKNK